MCAPTHLVGHFETQGAGLDGPDPARLFLCYVLHLVTPSALLVAELKDVTKRFSKVGVSNYTTLTLEDTGGLLYVGAREAIFALRTSNMELEEAVRWQGQGIRAVVQTQELKKRV